MNATTLPTGVDIALLQSIVGSTAFNILIAFLAFGLAVIPILNYLAHRREEKRRIREVVALEKQAQALYTISTEYVLVKRKK